jgi:two-component system copper resistance phosphate regulon response regulator CusR
VNHLRRKIDRSYDPKLVHTVKGVGYILEDRSDEILAAVG